MYVVRASLLHPWLLLLLLCFVGVRKPSAAGKASQKYCSCWLLLLLLLAVVVPGLSMLLLV
jgi:hypothetical protein